LLLRDPARDPVDGRVKATKKLKRSSRCLHLPCLLHLCFLHLLHNTGPRTSTSRFPWLSPFLIQQFSYPNAARCPLASSFSRRIHHTYPGAAHLPARLSLLAGHYREGPSAGFTDAAANIPHSSSPCGLAFTALAVRTPQKLLRCYSPASGHCTSTSATTKINPLRTSRLLANSSRHQDHRRRPANMGRGAYDMTDPSDARSSAATWVLQQHEQDSAEADVRH
jgi:hypothetical protein